MDITIITGLSGAGKTRACDWFEDKGYYCIDNIPPTLIKNFIELSMTGKKKNFTSLPYSTVSAFSVETAGVLDVDSRMELWFSGLGRVRFEFTGGSDTVAISRMIARYALA